MLGQTPCQKGDSFPSLPRNRSSYHIREASSKRNRATDSIGPNRTSSPHELSQNRCDTDVIVRWIEEILQRRVSHWISTTSLRESDRDDYLQELRLHLWQHMGSYCPEKSSLKTYLSRLADRKMSNLLRRERAAKRGGDRRVLSLNAFECLLERGNRSTALGSPSRSKAPGRNLSKEAIQEWERRYDFQVILDRLPPQLRLACHLLRFHSISETARRMHLHRATFHNRILRPLRRAFREVDLCENS